MEADLVAAAAKGHFVRIADLDVACGEGPLSADSVEKQRIAAAEIGALVCARVPFWSGFSRFLRCRKDFGQFSEVLGGGGEEEFVVCAAWTS